MGLGAVATLEFVLLAEPNLCWTSWIPTMLYISEHRQQVPPFSVLGTLQKVLVTVLSLLLIAFGQCAAECPVAVLLHGSGLERPSARPQGKP